MPGKCPAESSGISLDAASLEEEKITLLSAPDETTPEIQELARNLQHDPLLIFEFVRNRIEYVPYYGYLKGARQTLLDRAGNDADQASLLVALLRACGFTPQYVYGIQYIPTKASHGVTAARWFKVDDNTTAVDQTLIRNGIPGIASSDGTIMDRIWVKVAIGGSTRQLDPAFKLHTRPAGIDWAAAMGYDRFALLAAAGGETNANYVRGLNEPALYNALKNSSSNLVDYFRANYANASLAEITGEPEIIPLEYDELPTSLLFGSMVTTNWTTPPGNLIHTVRLQHGSIDKTYAVSDIAGKRLAITYTNAVAGMAMTTTPMTMPVKEESSGFQQGFTPSCTPLDVIEQPVHAQPATMITSFTDGGIDLSSFSNLIAGQIIEVVVPANPAADSKRATSSVDFSYVYTYSPYNILDGDVIGYTNPNSGILHVHTWLENNSGAFSIISYGGYFDIGQNQSFTVRIRFNGAGQTYGAKTANLRIQGWYTGGFVIDDTVNLSGRVVQEPRTGNSYGMNMGITWMNNPVTGAPRLVNNGNFDLYINWMSLVGSNADRFEFVSGSGSGWIGGGGGSRDINTRYKADAHGSHSATVRINFSYDGVTYEWDLLGLSGQAVYQPNLNGSYGCNYGTNYYQQPLDGACILKNSGSLALTINSISLTGANASQFLSKDPLELQGGLNLYAYGELNPLFYLDYLGLCAQNFDSRGNIKQPAASQEYGFVSDLRRQQFQAEEDYKRQNDPYYDLQPGYADPVSLLDSPLTFAAFGLARAAAPAMNTFKATTAKSGVSGAESATSGLLLNKSLVC